MILPNKCPIFCPEQQNNTKSKAHETFSVPFGSLHHRLMLSKGIIRVVRKHQSPRPLPSRACSASFGRGLRLLRTRRPFMVTFCFPRGNPLFPSWKPVVPMMVITGSSHGNKPFPSWERTVPAVGTVRHPVAM